MRCACVARAGLVCVRDPALALCDSGEAACGPPAEARRWAAGCCSCLQQPSARARSRSSRKFCGGVASVQQNRMPDVAG